jgi:hypothetical protein
MKTMKFLFLSIIYVIFTGCASQHREAVHVRTQPKSVQPKPQEVKTQKPSPSKGAVWELLTGEQVTLQLKNVDNGKNLTVIIEKGISVRTVPGGHWELTGFEENGHSYTSMNISKKFVFRMKPRANVYAGSIVIGCPKIAPDDFILLKQMKFFNRYPFSSSEGLCEMVIGNDFAGVRSEYKKIQKNKQLNLILGF